MGIHRQVPDALRQPAPALPHAVDRHPRLSALAILTLLPGQAEFLGAMYAFGAMLSFTMAHLPLMRAARRRRTSSGRTAGRATCACAATTLPLFAIVGGLGTSIAFVVIAVLNLAVAAAGVGWLALGILVYIAYRRRQGLDLVSTSRSRSRSRWSTTRRSTTPCSSRSSTAATTST